MVVPFGDGRELSGGLILIFIKESQEEHLQESPVIQDSGINGLMTKY